MTVSWAHSAAIGQVDANPLPQPLILLPRPSRSCAAVWLKGPRPSCIKRQHSPTGAVWSDCVGRQLFGVIRQIQTAKEASALSHAQRRLKEQQAMEWAAREKLRRINWCVVEL